MFDLNNLMIELIILIFETIYIFRLEIINFEIAVNIKKFWNYGLTLINKVDCFNHSID